MWLRRTSIRIDEKIAKVVKYFTSFTFDLIFDIGIDHCLSFRSVLRVHADPEVLGILVGGRSVAISRTSIGLLASPFFLFTACSPAADDSTPSQTSSTEESETVVPAGFVGGVDLNDVSILLAPPQNDADLAIAITDVEVAGVDVWSDEAFGRFLAIAGDQRFNTVAAGEVAGSAAASIGMSGFGNKADWHIAAVRIDPGAPGVSSAIAAEFGQSPQIRLVLQPVIGGEVMDVAAHLIFNFTKPQAARSDDCPLPKFEPDEAAFQAVIDDVLVLKRRLSDGEIGDQPIDTSGDLRIHPAADPDEVGTATQAAFHEALIGLLESHLHPQRLSAMAVMSLPQGAPEPWIFVAMAPNPATGDMVPVPSPALMQSDRPRFAQMLDARSGARVIPAAMTNNLNPITCKFEVLANNPAGSPVDPKGVSTTELFPNGDADRMREIVEVIADPTRSHFFNTDCVSCHTETRREMDILGTAKVDAPVDPAVLPQELWNVRNFGWFPSFLENVVRRNPTEVAATVTRRTATETEEVVGAINAKLRVQ